MIVSGCSKVLKLKFQKSDQEKQTLKQGSTLVTTAQVVSQFIENRKLFLLWTINQSMDQRE